MGADKHAMAQQERTQFELARACILHMCTERGAQKSVCPSECARKMTAGKEGWRDLMELIREQGVQLAHEGRIVVLQKNKVVNARNAKGPIRYRIIPPGL